MVYENLNAKIAAYNVEIRKLGQENLLKQIKTAQDIAGKAAAKARKLYMQLLETD